MTDNHRQFFFSISIFNSITYLFFTSSEEIRGGSMGRQGDTSKHALGEPYTQRCDYFGNCRNKNKLNHSTLLKITHICRI